MPLYIRDEAVAELAREVKQATGAKTVTEAVRGALEQALSNARDDKRGEDRFVKAMAIADSIGEGDPDFDFKKFREELWGG